MKKANILIIACLVILAGIPVIALCADTKYVDVQAVVPSQTGLSVTISKVVGTTFSAATAVDFGTLTWDSTNKLFKSNCYYSVDVGADTNASTWTITHAINTSVILSGGTEKLDGNINVSFNKQTSSGGTELSKYSLTDSNGKSFTNTQLPAGSWLRIYYGLATGSGDATNVTTIGLTKPAGTYKGQVKLTLAP